MVDEIQETLRLKFRDFGLELLQEREAMRALVRSVCDEDPEDANLLLLGYAAEIPSIALASDLGWPRLQPMLVKTLLDTYDLAREDAEWIAQTWAYAIGKISSWDLPEDEEEVERRQQQLYDSFNDPIKEAAEMPHWSYQMAQWASRLALGAMIAGLVGGSFAAINLLLYGQELLARMEHDDFIRGFVYGMILWWVVCAEVGAISVILFDANSKGHQIVRNALLGSVLAVVLYYLTLFAPLSLPARIIILCICLTSVPITCSKYLRDNFSI